MKKGMKLPKVSKTYKKKDDNQMKIENQNITQNITHHEQNSDIKNGEFSNQKQLPVLRVIDFIIKKQLNKKPKDYGDTEQLPHVKVAKWLIAHKGKTDEQLQLFYPCWAFCQI